MNLLHKVYQALLSGLTTRKSGTNEIYWEDNGHKVTVEPIGNEQYIVRYPSGNKAWYKNGLRHRENGPAVEFVNGTKHWYKNGKLHRKNGPAIKWADGGKEWYKNSLRHREDGPAVEWNGLKEYWKNGKRIK